MWSKEPYKLLNKADKSRVLKMARFLKNSNMDNLSHECLSDTGRRKTFRLTKCTNFIDLRVVHVTKGSGEAMDFYLVNDEEVRFINREY